MAFGRTLRKSIIQKDAPMVASKSDSNLTSKRSFIPENPRTPASNHEATLLPNSFLRYSESPARLSASRRSESPSKNPVTTPAQTGGSNALQRVKSQPLSNKASPNEPGGPSLLQRFKTQQKKTPGGPSPGNGQSPAWSSSPNNGPSYEDLDRVEGQWWLLEARNMRAETLRVHGDALKLKASFEELEEKTENLESELQRALEGFPAELQAAKDRCNTLQPELQQSMQTREQQEATWQSLTQQFQELEVECQPYRKTDIGLRMADLRKSRFEGRELEEELRRTQAALQKSELESSELEAAKRHNADLEASLRQVLEMVKSAKSVAPFRQKTPRKPNPKKGTKEYKELADERDVLQKEVTRLNVEIKKMQEAPSGALPQSLSNASQAPMASDVDSSGCGTGTIDVLTPRSQMTGTSLEPSEANFRFMKDARVRPKENATVSSSPTSAVFTPTSQMTLESREPSEANFRLDRDLQRRGVFESE